MSASLLKDNLSTSKVKSFKKVLALSPTASL